MRLHIFKRLGNAALFHRLQISQASRYKKPIIQFIEAFFYGLDVTLYISLLIGALFLLVELRSDIDLNKNY